MAQTPTSLVTGASGFIGSHLCQRLIQVGHTVHAISRQAPRECGHEKTDIRWWQADLADSVAVHDIVSHIKPDLVFHLASCVHGAREPQHVLPMFQSNLMSTVNLLTVLSDIGCQRVVLTGSLEEPDPSGTQAVPCSPYAAAKWASSGYARMFHALYQVPIVLLRVFMVYGPAQHDVNKLIPYAIRTLLRAEAPKLSSGQRQVDWIYVDDVVEACLAAARAEGIEGQTIDVGSGALVSIRTVIEHLVRIVNPQIEPLFGALPERPLEQVRVADTASSQALMHWQPRTTLETGLKNTVAWYAGRA